MQMTNALAPKLVAEFITTFALVFIGVGAAAVVGEGAGLSGIAATAFAPGLTIMVFVFAYGTVSGSHMNPSVTVGVLAAGAMSLVDAVGYIVAQLMGAIAAALALAVLGGVATSLGTPALAHDLALGTRSPSRRRLASLSRFCSPSSFSRRCSALPSPAAAGISRRSRSV